MIQFKSTSDLQKLPSDNPAQPIVSQLVHSLITSYIESGYPYDPDADGWVVLIEEGDQDRPLNEIWRPTLCSMSAGAGFQVFTTRHFPAPHTRRTRRPDAAANSGSRRPKIAAPCPGPCEHLRMTPGAPLTSAVTIRPSGIPDHRNPITFFTKTTGDTSCQHKHT